MITGLAFFFNLIINTVRSKIVAVFLGPDGVAVLAQLGSFATLAIALTSLGMAVAIVRYVAEYKAANRNTDLKKLLATATFSVAVLSSLVTVILLFLTPQVANFIFGQPTLLLLVALTLINIPISVVTNLMVSVLQGFKEIKLDAIFSVFSTLLTSILLVALLVPYGVTGAVIGMLIANYITSVIFFVFVIRAVNRHTEGRLQIFSPRKWIDSVRPSSIRPLFGIATASLVGGGITSFADILIRSNLIQKVGLTITGSLQPALTFSAQYTGLLSGAVNTYAVPRLSELSLDREKFIKEYNDYVKLLLLLVTPFAMTIAALASLLVPLLYSTEFIAAVPLVALQSVADVIKFAFVGISGAFLPFGRGKILLFLGASVPIMYFLFFLALLPVIGVKAVPVASGMSWAVAAGLSYLIMKRTIKIPISAKNFWLMFNSVIATICVAIIVNKTPLNTGITITVLIMLTWAIINIQKSEVVKLKELILFMRKKS